MPLTSNMELRLAVVIFFISSIERSHQISYSCNASAPCGCSMNSASVSRIVGGEGASTGTWSWAVSIKIQGRYLCGGSIISNQWVITAAHCVISRDASQFVIYAGSNAPWSGTQSRTVSQLIVHPGYNSDTYENDMALLKLSSPLLMTDPYVKQICLPSVSSETLAAGEWPTAGTTVVAVGWGLLNESGSLPSTLQQVSLQTIDYRAPNCQSIIMNKAVQLCASAPGDNKDTCQGDSGGPLMMFDSQNRWVLIGLTSYGNGCARPGYAGVYTRVAAYQNWIDLTRNEFSSTSTSTSTATTKDGSVISSKALISITNISNKLNFLCAIISLLTFLRFTNTFST